MNCPVCNKKIKTKSHIKRCKDDNHQNYAKKQLELAFKLYNKYKILEKVLNHKDIFLNEYVELELRKKYDKEIKK